MWDIVHTLLHLPGIANLTSFDQCSMEHMFSSENDPDIEMVSNVSEFLGDTLNIRDNDSALVYLSEGQLLPDGFITVKHI
jgi:hypothetical protein